jgi:FG-GAP-like repeat
VLAQEQCRIAIRPEIADSGKQAGRDRPWEASNTIVPPAATRKFARAHRPAINRRVGQRRRISTHRGQRATHRTPAERSGEPVTPKLIERRAIVDTRAWVRLAMAGDFNGDGKLDLAVATDNGIAILLGNGDGTFQSFSLLPSLLSYAPGDELLALADFNNDGLLDVIKATQSGAALINVALGNGDGTFQQAQAFPIPSILNTESTVVGDFNGDGKTDLAFASQSSDVVTILFGNGDGTFAGHIEYAVPSVSNNVNFMVAADFNGDGALDMALADFGASEVSVFINQPVAAFAPRALNFANQGLDMPSPAQSVTLANVGPAPLIIASIAASADFAETNNCGSSLTVGKVCAASVTFAPTADGVRSGLLTFTDNASVVPQALVLSGTGTGAGFQISVASGSSASQTVPAGQPASYSLVFTPEGGFTGTIALACSGAPAGANCTATPASLTFTGSSAVTVMIKVSTGAVALIRSSPK